jgi:parallel beta-helix repeat protein
MLHVARSTLLVFILLAVLTACSQWEPVSSSETPEFGANRIEVEDPTAEAAKSTETPRPTTTVETVIAATETSEPPMNSLCTGQDRIQKAYYVRVDGNNDNSGLENTPEGAFATITYGVAMLCPGDHLYVEDGTYIGRGLLVKNLHAEPDNPTIISAANSWGAVIILDDKAEDDEDGIRIANSSYVIISGFQVISNGVSPAAGIEVRQASHHVTIRDNYVFDFGCNGISSRHSDYLVFEGNVVRGNAKRNEWNCSGISIWHPIEHDQEPGYHIIIRNNVVFENECDLPFRPHGHKVPTDGNGIIIDDFRNKQGGGQKGGYRAAVLVENNLSFNNGGRGIHVFQSDNTVVRNNTVYHNQRILSKYTNTAGEISLSSSHGSQVYNNLAIQNPDLFVPALILLRNDGMNTRVYNNIIIGNKHFGNQTIFDDSNQFLSKFEQDYPRFNNPTVEVEYASIADFRRYFGISASSPAAGAGLADDAPEDDLEGKSRLYGEGIDIGCYTVD